MRKKSSIKILVEYTIARLVLLTLGLAPRKFSTSLGVFTGELVYRFSGRLRKVGERNLALAFPELEDSERTRILKASFASLGRMLGEFSQFEKTSAEKLHNIVEYQGLDNLREAQKRGNGVIFLTSHLGAWELSSFAHSAFGNPHYFLVRPIDNNLIEEMIERMRMRFGNQAINKKAAAREVLRLLRKGKSVGILADLNTQPHEGVFVPFFNHLACTTASVATFSLRTSASIIPACIPWIESQNRFVLRFDPAIEYRSTGDRTVDIAKLTALCTKAIEGHIREYPDQWLWIHKRWNTRPQGDAGLYS
ncbi:MAG: lysophospholipid acyltransferase family protein [Pyrinomonadaceae bacterium]